MLRRFFASRLLLLTLLTILALTISTQAQTSECVDTIKKSDGFLVRSVKVDARGNWVPSIILPIKSGDVFDPDTLLPSFRAVRAALRKDDSQANFEIGNRGEVSVLWVTSCVKKVEPSVCKATRIPGPPTSGDDSTIVTDTRMNKEECVDVVIKPTFIRVGMYDIGSNLLPEPRSNLPTFYQAAPRPLLALNPTFGTDYDREYGFSEKADIKTNLLDLPAILRRETAGERNSRLDLELGGRKSVDEPFYDAHARLAFSLRRPGKFVEDASFGADLATTKEPLGEGTYFENELRLGGSLQMRPRVGFISSVTAGGKYSRTGNRFFNNNDTRSELASQNAFEGRAIIDGRLAGGFMRLGLWAEHAAPENPFDSYDRLAGLLGYEKEFGKANQTFGLEVLVGGGRVRGDAPEYARFFGGNSTRDFLYDAHNSVSVSSMPSGPLLRSYGKGQAGGQSAGGSILGGTSYWHVNLNLSIPVPQWSRELIPGINVLDDNQDVGEEGGNQSQSGTLKDILKGQVNTAESMLALRIQEELMEQGMSPDEAEAEAEDRARKVISEIRPAVTYIADRANIYAVKPLIMIDWGRIGVPDSLEGKTRVGIGGGLQLTVVIARFEVGYMRAVRRQENDPKGNFVIRLVFQNLF
jgi:hypothetical protein